MNYLIAEKRGICSHFDATNFEMEELAAKKVTI
jgi:hypothetical protein